MVHFSLRNGLFRMPKWCFLQCEEMSLKYKSLISNILWKPLIFRVFAPGGKSVSKYALIFRGIWGNSEPKFKIRLQIESCPYRHIPTEGNTADQGAQ